MLKQDRLFLTPGRIGTKPRHRQQNVVDLQQIHIQNIRTRNIENRNKMPVKRQLLSFHLNPIITAEETDPSRILNKKICFYIAEEIHYISLQSIEFSVSFLHWADLISWFVQFRLFAEVITEIIFKYFKKLLEVTADSASYSGLLTLLAMIADLASYNRLLALLAMKADSASYSRHLPLLAVIADSAS